MSRETLEAPRTPMPGFPFADPPQLSQGPLTVVNPEKRVRSGSGSNSKPAGGEAPAPSSAVDPELGSRLFPSEYSDSGQTPNLTGVRLEHFEIEERIGVGGMGAVFRAVDLRLKRIVALKVLSPSQSRDPSSVQRFELEALAGARFDHENIARVYHVGQDRGIHFIAFEHVAGVNLRDVIRANGRLDPGEAVSYTLQIASALRHTNAAGVIHRDIKPSNIIITPTGRAKLVDLGLARTANSDGAADLTIAGTTLGTFDYISPEQARDPRSVDVRSDIYSLGCTLYHMLTGEPPYPEGTVLQKLLDHQGGDTPDPAAKNRHVTPELSAVVRRMMASEPKRRFATPDEVIQQLLVLAGQLGLRAMSGDGLIWTGTRSRLGKFWEKNLPWMLTASVLLLVVVVLDRFPALGQKAIAPGTLADKPRGSEGRVRNPLAPSPSLPGTVATSESETLRSPDGSRSNPRNVEPLRVPRDGSQKPGFPTEDPTLASNVPPGESRRIGDSGDGGSVGQGKTTRSERSGTGSPTAEVLPPPFDDPALHRLVPTLSANDFPSPPRPSSPGPEFVGAKLPVPPAPSAVSSPSGDSDPPREKTRSPGATAVASAAARIAEGIGAGPAAPREVSPSGESTRPMDNPGAERPAKPGDPRPAAEVKPAAIVVYSANGGEPKSFPTLEAACAQADDGQVIELRYNGSREPEKPFRIANRKMTIRAAKGFRPVVEFLVKDSAAPGQSNRMITLAGGALEFNHVDFRLTVVDQFAVKEGDWATLVSLSGAEQVRFQAVAVTVVNPSGRPVAVVEIAPGSGPSMSKMKMMAGAMPVERPRYDVKFSESSLRGNSDVAVVRHTNPGQIDLDQCLVSVEGSVLALQGGVEPPAAESAVRIQMEHVTAAVGNGLVRVDSGDPPRELLPISFQARNNIVGSRTPVALVSMNGTTNAEDFRRLLRWHGERNFYDRFESFWSISTPLGTTDFDRLDFDGWKRIWAAVSETSEVGATRGGLPWKERWWEKTAREASQADFELQRTNAPAIGGATDGSDAGVDAVRLSAALRASAQ